MRQSGPSRIRDQRYDIKVSPEVYKDLAAVKDLLEEARTKPFSMSEVIMLLCQWSEPKITNLREVQAKLDELTTKKRPLGAYY